MEYGQPNENKFNLDKRFSPEEWVRSLKTSDDYQGDYSRCPLDGNKCPTVLASLRAKCPIAVRYGVKCPLLEVNE